MERAARDVFHRLNPNFKNIRVPVRSLSGGQRQVVAISRALHFNASALIMDEPCAALGPEETRMVHDLVRKLKAGGVGIFLISHDMPDVFGLSDRLSVMKNARPSAPTAPRRSPKTKFWHDHRRQEGDARRRVLRSEGSELQFLISQVRDH